jgi:hypothetical protein
MKFPASCGNHMFIAVLTTALHLYLCSETAVQYIPLSTISLRSVLNTLMEIFTYRVAENFQKFQPKKHVFTGPTDTMTNSGFLFVICG